MVTDIGFWDVRVNRKFEFRGKVLYSLVYVVGYAVAASQLQKSTVGTSCTGMDDDQCETKNRKLQCKNLVHEQRLLEHVDISFACSGSHCSHSYYTDPRSTRIALSRSQYVSH